MNMRLIAAIPLAFLCIFCFGDNIKNMEDLYRSKLVGMPASEVEAWMKENTVRYGFETRQFLVSSGTEAAQLPFMDHCRGRYNGILKDSKEGGSGRVTSAGCRVYVYIDISGVAIEVGLRPLVTGP